MRGNTLAIVGAALVPLAGMIGSGVDMSRAYMAKTRLQSACDAGSLAARRVMTGDSLTDAVRAEGTKYFNFNFPQGLYKTAAFTPQITKPEAGTIRIQASTTMPTAIMKIFGYQTLPLAVECKASQNFVNTDIVLVLDVTLSMICTPEESGMCSRTVEIPTSRIVGLRSAVMALYDQLRPVQTQLEASGMRLRYGIVPFSANVNVGKLINSGYLADSWTYQSRTPIYQTTTQVTYTNKTNSQCNVYVVPRTPANSYPATEKTVYRPGTANARDCIVTTHNYSTDNTGQFVQWFHEARVLNTALYKTAVPTPVPSRVPGTNVNSKWAGCIEERETVDNITASSGFTIPAAAWDLNIDKIPDSEDTRWRPYWPEVVYSRGTQAGQTVAAGEDSDNQQLAKSSINVACVPEAKKLQAWERADLQTYVNGLVPTGYTYHDIGMIWGARLISAGGIFASSPETFNNMPVAKHIIFMTDGEISPSASIYSSYGIEKFDQRITGSSNATGQLAAHKQRFRMLCNAVKGRNVSVWVVAFATSTDSSMSECASNAAQFSASGSSADLIAKFVEIGKNIGALRLTQ